MEKYYNEKGQVGVIISPTSYSEGWSTWNGDNALLVFDKKLVEAVLNKDWDTVEFLARKIDSNIVIGGIDDIKVEFLEPGTMFYIDDFAGSGDETIVICEPNKYFVA